MEASVPLALCVEFTAGGVKIVDEQMCYLFFTFADFRVSSPWQLPDFFNAANL